MESESRKPFRLSVKAVVRDGEGRCLLLRRNAESKANAGKWDFPGGKQDAGETLDDAVAREVLEETGLTIAIGRVVGAAESESSEARVAYLVVEAIAGGSEVRLGSEHDAYAWAPRASLPEYDMAPQFRAFAAAYAANSK